MVIELIQNKFLISYVFIYIKKLKIYLKKKKTCSQDNYFCKFKNKNIRCIQ